MEEVTWKESHVNRKQAGMKQEDLIKVIEQQDKRNTKLVRENTRQLIEEEFILGNVLLKYLDFIEQRGDTEKYFEDMNELMHKMGGPLVKKLKDFDISKHITDQSMYLHKHTYIEADYVYKGSCNYYIDNESPFQLQEKQFCILNQNVVHGIETQGADNIIIKCMIPFEYIELEQFSEVSQKTEIIDFLTNAMSENITKPNYLIFQISDTEYIEELIYHMFCELREKNTGWRRVVKNNLSNLFLYLIRAEAELLQIKEVGKETLNITMLLDYIRRNYQVITLKDLSKDFHYHENYLSRVIKQHCQMNFRELLCQMRLNEAQKLLSDTELPVTEIAARIGYQKPNFFFKSFKEHYNMTPTVFRHLHRKK